MATRKKSPKPFWERGFDTHGYWRGKEKIGWVSLGGKDSGGLYQWQTGTHSGACKTLDEAKRMVEQAVAHGASQLGLFGEASE